MAKAWDEFPIKRKAKAPDKPELVRVRFVVDCIHCHLPFKAGDEIMVEPHWADSIERIGSGHRITNHNEES
jgi:hypothetical protein